MWVLALPTLRKGFGKLLGARISQSYGQYRMDDILASPIATFLTGTIWTRSACQVKKGPGGPSPYPVRKSQNCRESGLTTWPPRRDSERSCIADLALVQCSLERSVPRHFERFFARGFGFNFGWDTSDGTNGTAFSFRRGPQEG